MKKKEYIQNVENLILNKLKYHAPILNSDNIDYDLIDAVGIDTSYPIFILKKPMTKPMYRAFCNVKKKEEFNLILLSNPLFKGKKLDKLSKTFKMIESETSPNLIYSLDALNINYLTHTNYLREYEEEFVKFNGQKLLFDYIPYYYSKKILNNGVILQASQFLLSGKNYIFNFTNTKKIPLKASFEINIPLPRGYYYFKKMIDHVEIKNLTSNEKMYFNYHINNSKITFSNMSGVESCTFAVINLKAEIDLMPLQNKKLFFSFSPYKFTISNPKDMNFFFNLSQNKMNEIFDIKVTSHDKVFDNLFNCSLPQNIWEKWQKNDIDEKSENEWLKMRNQIVFCDEKGASINEKFKGLKEVKFFRNLGWKRVFILHNNSCYMYADKIKYFGFTLLTKEIFKKNNEIYLSFGK